MEVLYSDNHILAVQKPVNVPVQADSSGDEDLLSICREYIRVTFNKPGDVYLGLLHRLDRPVGGVVVFARTSKAASRLSAQIREGEWQKRYLAVVKGEFGGKNTLVDYLVKDEQTRTSRIAPMSAKGAKRAEMEYETLSCAGGYTLLSVDLKTGRHHQIRVQLANAGMPIWGDARYNPTSKPGEQIALFAKSVSLIHPTTKEPLAIVAPTPRVRPFGLFEV